MATVEETLHDAARDGGLEDVLSLLRDNPGLDVNWATEDDKKRALHVACASDHVEVVKVLLAHPGIDVNAVEGSSCRYHTSTVASFLS